MRIEKLSEDKIRITLNMEDLEKEHIDFHSFMANSSASQELFLDVLKKAEQEVGFKTKDYRVMIEALATPDGNFILTVTRITPELERDRIKKKKIKIKRKNSKIEDTEAIYAFQTFDDFLGFCQYIASGNLKTLHGLSSRTTLHRYENSYYLLLEGIHTDYTYLKNFYSSITEFARYVESPKLFKSKLLEHGELFIKSNAIKTCMKHFCA